MAILHASQSHEPWDKGKLLGQKAPLKLKDICAICLKQYRAIATHYDKTACNFLGAIYLAAAVVWLN